MMYEFIILENFVNVCTDTNQETDAITWSLWPLSIKIIMSTKNTEQLQYNTPNLL